MSAFLCGKDHIDLLVTAALEYQRHGGRFSWYWGGNRKELDQYAGAGQVSPDELGRILIGWNVSSLDARYGRGSWDPEASELLAGYRWDHTGKPTGALEVASWQKVREAPDPVLVLKALACLEYQCCEAEGWREAEGAAVARSLQDAAIMRLPGWDEAAGWEYRRERSTG